MINDKELDTLLAGYKPELGQEADFMEQLSRRMDAVDMVMEYKAREMRLSRRRAAVAFVAGALAGIFFTFLAMLLPSPVELFGLTIHSAALHFLLCNFPYFVLAFCIPLLVYGVVGLVRESNEMMGNSQWAAQGK